MERKKVLALSSSRAGNGQYLEKAIPLIERLLGNKKQQVAFVPFAAVDEDYDTYTNMVKHALAAFPYTINTVLPGDHSVIINADAIIVGGGNTFKLLYDVYKYEMVELIKNKVNNGTPYIGWSAGANLTGLSIGTTNDMPIIMPPSFNALQLLPFLINPHYTNQSIQGHFGETRDQRIKEYVTLNTGTKVICLPEGTALLLMNNTLTYHGDIAAASWLKASKNTEAIKEIIQPASDLSYLP